MSTNPESFREKYKRSLATKKQDVPEYAEIGKVPPQATEIEENVLGGALIEKDAINQIVDILSPDAFYKQEHKVIYQAMLDLFEKAQPIDILTVTNQLRENGELELIGGAYFISGLTNSVGSAANIEYHARIIVEKYIMRELIRVSSRIQQKAYDETNDVFDLLDEAEKSLFEVTEGNLRSGYDSMSTLIRKAIEQIEELKGKTDGLSGVPSGFTALDRVTSGWQTSDLVIVAARPGMGKTSFLLALARNAAADFSLPVGIFSLEMSALQLVHRLIAGEAEIDAKKLRNGELENHEWQQLHSKIGKLSEAPIYIDDTPGINVFELRAKCRRMKAQNNVQLIVVDYLQLMSGQKDKNTNREQEISNISRAMKSISKELNIPVIALSQLSREVEKRGGSKRPILSDLRESGSIEQDADQVMFIYRPEYYGLTEDEDGNPTDGVAEIIIAKNRHGSVETVPLKFVEQFAKFDDLEEEWGGNDFGSGGGGQEGGRIRKGSRLNEQNGDDEEAPF